MTKQHYYKEEEFVDEFYNWAAAAAQVVENAWRPNDQCNDEDRRQADYFLKSGQMTWLTFSSATLGREHNNTLYAHILLESSSRTVTIKVSTQNNVSVANILSDKSRP